MTNKSGKSKYYCQLGLGLFAIFFLMDVSAHEMANMNDTSINRTNDNIAIEVNRTQEMLSQIFMRSRTITNWPAPELSDIQDKLLHLREEVDTSLDYFAEQGVNFLVPEVLHSRPLAGRTVSGSQAVNVAIALLRHAESLDSSDSFISEIYNQELSALMYNLLGAHLDRMALYSKLMEPDQ